METHERKNPYDEHHEFPDIPWKAWGSWFSWGSPVGLSIFILSLGGFLVLLHLANIIR